jgi:hypothetical protein
MWKFIVYFFFNDILFVDLIFFLFLGYLEWSKQLWVCQTKLYIFFLSFKGKATTQKNYEKINMLNLKSINNQTLTMFTFDHHIFLILCLFWVV